MGWEKPRGRLTLNSLSVVGKSLPHCDLEDIAIPFPLLFSSLAVTQGGIPCLRNLEHGGFVDMH